MVFIKNHFFLELRTLQSQKNRRETKPLALSKLLVFINVSLNQQHLARRQLKRKQMSKEIIVI